MDNTFWATVALFIFIGVVVYYKVPAAIAKASVVQRAMCRPRRGGAPDRSRFLPAIVGLPCPRRIAIAACRAHASTLGGKPSC